VVEEMNQRSSRQRLGVPLSASIQALATTDLNRIMLQPHSTSATFCP
jgi:hypothetical protein